MARSKGQSSGFKKFLLALGVIVLLVGLFFLSYFITTMSLRSNQETDFPTETEASATEEAKVDLNKLSKKDLIKLVKEKDKEIEELKKELAGGLATQAPIETAKPSESAKSAATAKPAATAASATKKPETATKAPATKAPAASAQTAAPKPTSAPKPTAAPTAAPTVAPQTQAPAPIQPVAPAAE